MPEDAEQPKKPKKPGPAPGTRWTSKTEIFSARVTPKQKIALQKVLEAMKEASEPSESE